MEKRHRIFISINLPGEVKKALIKRQEALASQFVVDGGELAKWTKPNNLHITLEFMGYLTDEETADACIALKDVAEKHESFEVNINQVVYGPKDKMPPRMIWAIGEKSKELSNLREDLEKSLLEKVRFTPEGKASAPHITLARLNSFAFRQMNQEEIPEINENVELLFTVESIEVMESEMKKGGPVYTILESHQLK
jgi:2'-5' RNA ligase